MSTLENKIQKIEDLGSDLNRFEDILQSYKHEGKAGTCWTDIEVSHLDFDAAMKFLITRAQKRVSDTKKKLEGCLK